MRASVASAARAFALLLAALTTHCRQASAGAWTLPDGDSQIIAGVTYSTASKSFDDSGNTVPISYRKILSQAYIEYGLTNDYTLILEPA